MEGSHQFRGSSIVLGFLSPTSQLRQADVSNDISKIGRVTLIWGREEKDGKNVILQTFFPSFFPLPYTRVTPPLSLMSYLSSLSSNCIQKAMTFACLSWDVGLKKSRPILLGENHSCLSFYISRGILFVLRINFFKTVIPGLLPPPAPSRLRAFELTFDCSQKRNCIFLLVGHLILIKMGQKLAWSKITRFKFTDLSADFSTVFCANFCFQFQRKLFLNVISNLRAAF